MSRQRIYKKPRSQTFQAQRLQTFATRTVRWKQRDRAKDQADSQHTGLQQRLITECETLVL